MDSQNTGVDPHFPDFGTDKNLPVSCLIVGMAGAGKTSFVSRFNSYISQHNKPGYVINLDPAVAKVPYKPNIDIRDSINFKQVMTQYGLGPNGAIMTSLNLFATRFDQIIGFLEKRSANLQYVLVDTPGQIEVFNWSASGTIITDSFASTYPTVLLYIIDSVRCTNPVTFMSNMLYACSLYYKSKLPIILVFNKTDVQDNGYAIEWMNNLEEFEEAIRSSSSYMSDLSTQMARALEEFYTKLKTVGVSSLTGSGFDDLLTAIHETRGEYDEYKQEIEEKKKKFLEKEVARQERELAKMKVDQENELKGKPLHFDKTPMNVLGQSITLAGEDEMDLDDVNKFDIGRPIHPDDSSSEDDE